MRTLKDSSIHMNCVPLNRTIGLNYYSQTANLLIIYIYPRLQATQSTFSMFYSVDVGVAGARQGFSLNHGQQATYT